MASELPFIAALRRLATHPGARHLEDDCAVIDFGNETLVLTHDAMAEGVHFVAGQDPADVAWKLVTVNISDLAAKGAEPLGVLLGYTLGTDDLRFVEGLQTALAHYDVPLLGGDTISRNGGQVLGLTALGRATHLPVPARSGVSPGETLYVSGPLGAAMMAFEALGAGTGDTTAYRRPRARLAEGIAVASHVTAMMDISDGLLLDAVRMAQASGVTLAIDRSAVPIAAPEERRDAALRWGDDYELMFTAPADRALPISAWRIGEAICAGEAPILVDGSPPEAGEPLGFEHG